MLSFVFVFLVTEYWKITVSFEGKIVILVSTSDGTKILEESEQEKI